MEYENIKKAKVGDKIVVIGTVKDIEVSDGNYHYRVELPNECGGTTKRLGLDEILGKLSDFQPAEEKIKFTLAEKKEFDKLLEERDYSNADLNDFLNTIYDYSKTYSALHKQLFENAKGIIDRKKQFKFVHALENPDLVEVEKEKKYYLPVFGEYVNQSIESQRYYLAVKEENPYYKIQFTQSEIDEMQKLDKFKGIDLNNIKELVEDE